MTAVYGTMGGQATSAEAGREIGMEARAEAGSSSSSSGTSSSHNHNWKESLFLWLGLFRQLLIALLTLKLPAAITSGRKLLLQPISSLSPSSTRTTTTQHEARPHPQSRPARPYPYGAYNTHDTGPPGSRTRTSDPSAGFRGFCPRIEGGSLSARRRSPCGRLWLHVTIHN